MDIGGAKDSLTENIKKFVSKDPKLKLIVVLGLLGMLLILISQFTAGGAAPASQPDRAAASFTADQYIEDMENRLKTLISGIEGVGRAEVMLTLESGVEYVYAREEKRNSDITRDPGSEQQAGRIYEKENIEQRYILIDTEYGRKQALVLTERQPKIQGVIIVCEGADNIRVQDKLVSVVTTALGISSARVCVVKIG